MGCRRELPQCGLSFWPIARALGGTRVGDVLPPRSGASAHVDKLCVPAWSLQLSGRKRWLFPVRRPGDGTPLGEAYEGDAAWAVTLSPGELMLFFNGWSTHTTEVPPEDPPPPPAAPEAAASLHGALYLPHMASHLFGPEAMARRCGAPAGCALLSAEMGEARCRAELLALNPSMRAARAPQANVWISRLLRQRRDSVIDRFVRSSHAGRDDG